MLRDSRAKQQPVSFNRDYCVKVRDGKWAESATFLHDVTTKLAKVRLDAGNETRRTY